MIKTEGWAQSQKPDQQVTAVPKVMIPTQTVLLNSKREKQNVPGESPFQTDNSPNKTQVWVGRAKPEKSNSFRSVQAVQRSTASC